MNHLALFPYLRETLFFLALVGILIPLLQRLRVNQVVGFLIAGMLVGPQGLAREVQTLAELGVIFLMFLIGLELSVPRMWAMRRWVFLGGLTQVVLSALLIAGLVRLLDQSLATALLLGAVLSLSSTAVVVQLLSQQRALAKPLGQAAFAILMLQDIAVIPLMIFVDMFSSQPTGNLVFAMSLAALKSVAVVVLIFLVGRTVIRPLFRLFAQQRQPEVFMALTLLIALSTAGATAVAGLSLALGAFLAGLLLAETEYRHEVEVMIEPFKGLFMGLFFMSVGMLIDLETALREPLGIALCVIGLLLSKTLVAAAVLRIGRLSWGKSLEGGTLLAQGGEFAFIILGTAAVTQLMPNTTTQFVLVVVSISLMVTPLFAKLGAYLGAKIDDVHTQRVHAHEFHQTSSLKDHIIIAGQGRIGQLLADVLYQQGVDYVALEHDAVVVAKLVEKKRPVFFGNASRTDLLHKLNAAQAAAFIVTMDQPASAMHAVRAARRAYPSLPIYARSRDEQHACELLLAGATAVVPETLEAGLQLSSFALQAGGLGESQVAAAVQAERASRVVAKKD